MGFSQVFAANALVRLFRGDTTRADLTVAMAGPKLGDRVLVAGLGEPALLAALAARVGLTGRACGADPSPDAVARAQRTAERAGVLVELVASPLDRLPYEPDSFDIVVVRARGELAGEAPLDGILRSCGEALRNGGRCLIAADGRRQGWRALLGPSRRTGSLDGDRLVQQVTAAGYRGARVLADREGLLFVEAVRRKD